MKWSKVSHTALLSLAFLLLTVLTANADERILSFTSDIDVSENSSMLVTETIRVSAEGTKIKRGIYRDFPTRYRDRFGSRVNVDFQLISVKKDGVVEPHHIKKQSNGVRIYIGHENVFLERGIYTYEITYSTTRQLGYFEEHDELYWNVTGNGWDFPIDYVEARVYLPEKVPVKDVGLEAYTGFQGDKRQDYTSGYTDSGQFVFKSTRKFVSNEGMTIVVMFPKGFVYQPDFQKKLEWFLEDNRGIFSLLIGFCVVFIYYFVVWMHVGRDPDKGVIVPLYEPPNNLSPAAVRFISRMGFDNRAYTAAILNLAVGGNIEIEDEKGTYTLKRKEDSKWSHSSGESKILTTLLPGTHSSLELKNTNHKKISSAKSKLKKSLKGEYEKVYFYTNSKFMIPALIITVLAIVGSAFYNSPESGAITLFMSIWLSGWTFGCIALGKQVWSAWQQVFSRKEGRFFKIFGALFISAFSIPFFIGEGFGITMLVAGTSVPFVVLVVLFGILHWLFYHLLKRPTKLGRKILDGIEGFKLYLGTAEGDELRVMSPINMTPEYFEKFLPYALALGVEQEWSEKFASVLQSASQGVDGGYQPHWYRSSSSFDRAFDTSNFASSFGDSFSSAISSAGVAPGSSSGGGGGGSSGGGGGGGGGGGW